MFRRFRAGAIDDYGHTFRPWGKPEMNNEKRKRVEARAYEIWQREGCPDGKSDEHWRRAVAEIGHESAETGPPKMKKAAPKKKAEKIKAAVDAKTTSGRAASKAKASKKEAARADPKSADKTKARSAGKTKKTGK